MTQKAEKMLRDGHYNTELVRSIAENITAKWQQLMFRAEERMKLVMASLNWFKTAEQVKTYIMQAMCQSYIVKNDLLFYFSM